MAQHQPSLTSIPDVEYDVFEVDGVSSLGSGSEQLDSPSSSSAVSSDYTLIFIHSLLCHKGFWRMQVPYFTTIEATDPASRYGNGNNRQKFFFRCVTCNLPGISQEFLVSPSNGRSNKRNKKVGKEAPTIKMLGQSVAKLIKQHSSEWKKVVLVGHSMGYRVAMESVFCLLEEQQHARQTNGTGNNNIIQGLVILDGDYSSTGDFAQDELMLSNKIKAAGGSFLDMILPFFHGVHFDSQHDDLKQDLLQKLTTFDTPQDIQLYKNMIEFDSSLLPRLHAIDIPILVLQSTKRNVDNGSWESMQSPHEISPFQALMSRYVRYCQTQTIAEGGHFLMLDHPHEVNAAIESFVQRLIHAETFDVDVDLQNFLHSCRHVDPLPMDESDDMLFMMDAASTSAQQHGHDNVNFEIGSLPFT